MAKGHGKDLLVIGEAVAPFDLITQQRRLGPAARFPRLSDRARTVRWPLRGTAPPSVPGIDLEPCHQ